MLTEDDLLTLPQIPTESLDTSFSSERARLRDQALREEGQVRLSMIEVLDELETRLTDIKNSAKAAIKECLEARLVYLNHEYGVDLGPFGDEAQEAAAHD